MNRHLSTFQRLLWLLAFLAVVEPFIQWRLSLAYGSLTLPIALLVALMDWLNAPEKADDGDDGYLLVSGLTFLLAIFSLLLALIVFQLPQLINPDAPTAVGQLMGYGWFVCATAAVWALLFWRVGFDGRWSAALLTGVMGGGLLTFFLAYPAYYFAAGIAFGGPPHWGTIIGAGTLAAFIALAIGPIAARCSQAVGWAERLTVGAAAGGAAGIVLFGLCGAALAGMFAADGLYGVAVSRAGYGEDVWVARVAAAVNGLGPITLLLFWLLTAGGVLIGGVTATLTPSVTPTTERSPRPASVWPIVVLIVAMPWTLALALANTALFTLLAYSLIDLFKQYPEAINWWPPFTVTLLVIQPLIVLHLLQIAGLVWLWRLSAQSPPLQRSGSCLGNGAGLLGLVLLTATYMVAPPLGPYLVASALLSGAFFIAAGRLSWSARRASPTSAIGLSPHPPLLSWVTAGIGGGLLTAALADLSIAIVVSIYFGVIPIVGELANTAAPPGVAWLAVVLQDWIVWQARGFLAVTAVGVLFGSLAGWLISWQAPSYSSSK
jgi:hypothetical protein